LASSQGSSKLIRNLTIGILAGALLGALLGSHAEPLGEVGSLFIRFLKALATPLLFFGVIDTFCKSELSARDGARLIAISSLNALVALVISFFLTRALPLDSWIHFDQIRSLVPAHLEKITRPEVSFTQVLEGFIPGNLIEPFQQNNVIAVVVLAILFGAGIRSQKNKEIAFPIDQWVSEMFVVISKILGWFVHLVPIAVFCVIAKAVGTGGFAWLQTLSVFVAIVFAGMSIQVAVYYSLLLKLAGFGPILFFKQASEALLTAMSTGSSLATLPVTLETLQNKMKIPPRFARLAAAVGTNLNHDGILLYEAVAAVFVARLFGIELSFGRQLTIAATSVLASIGIAGVPEAGLITLSLVLTAAGLPLEAVALFLPFDWLIGRFRATTNVSSDLTVAHLLYRLGSSAGRRSST
jgi:Na+/H+-dicarboxylate symporter